MQSFPDIDLADRGPVSQWRMMSFFRLVRSMIKDGQRPCQAPVQSTLWTIRVACHKRARRDGADRVAIEGREPVRFGG
jgi:hypothetical protein